MAPRSPPCAESVLITPAHGFFPVAPVEAEEESSGMWLWKSIIPWKPFREKCV